MRQDGLADAGLTRDEDRRPVALLGARDGVAEQRELGGPLEELRHLGMLAPLGLSNHGHFHPSGMGTGLLAACAGALGNG